MLPLAALSRRSPAATPTHVSPLEFLITALPSSSPRRTSPELAVTSTWPVARATVMSPAPLFRFSASALSSWMRPRPVVMRQSPSGPSPWRSPMPSFPCTREPAGSAIVTSIDGPPLLLSQERSFGALTRSRSSAYSMRVSSAALTSSSLDASLGCTSTTVVRRSPALIRTSPTARSIVAEIGSGVSKVGMALPSWKVRFEDIGGLVGGADGPSVSAPSRCRPGRSGRHAGAGGGRRARARQRPRERARR